MIRKNCYLSEVEFEKEFERDIGRYYVIYTVKVFAEILPESGDGFNEPYYPVGANYITNEVIKLELFGEELEDHIEYNCEFEGPLENGLYNCGMELPLTDIEKDKIRDESLNQALIEPDYER